MAEIPPDALARMRMLQELHEKNEKRDSPKVTNAESRQSSKSQVCEEKKF